MLHNKNTVLNKYFFYLIFLSILFFTLFYNNAFVIGVVEPKIIVTPDTPDPYEDVTLELEYFLSDLNKINITWTKNGSIVEQGRGIKTLTTKVGGLGEETRIGVSFTTPEGESFSKSVVIRPATLDILWEADTYVPNFYKGKALPSSQSKIKVVAIPIFVTQSGNRIDDSELFYTWSTPNGLVEGQGKNYIFLDSDLLNDRITISLSVQNNSESFVKKGSVVIDSVEPEVVLYEEKPLLGPLYENALGDSIELQSGEMSIRAEPYYFSNDTVLFDTEYRWVLGNKPLSPHKDDPRVVTIVKNFEEGLGGGQKLSVKVISRTKLRQVAENFLSIF